jgi:hypothetical protein
MLSFLVKVPLKSSNQTESDLCVTSYHELSEYVQKFAKVPFNNFKIEFFQTH